MIKLVNLVNVFALLSLLAVGGGTAVLPQMKHDVVVTHRWLSAEQFTDIYSLGQLSPGPNMNMVTVIGYHVSGIPGAILVLLAYAIGRTATINLDRSMRFNETTVAITVLVTVILLRRHINPALLILAGGAVGWFGLRMV
jgi:chromate transporter